MWVVSHNYSLCRLVTFDRLFLMDKTVHKLQTDSACSCVFSLTNWPWCISWWVEVCNSIVWSIICVTTDHVSASGRCLRLTTVCWEFTSLLIALILHCASHALARSRWIFVHLKVSEVRWGHVRTWSRRIIFWYGLKLLYGRWPYHLRSSLVLESGEQVQALRIITWIVYTRAWGVALSSVVEPVSLTWRPYSCAGVWNSRQRVISSLVDFDAASIMTRRWAILLLLNIHGVKSVVASPREAKLAPFSSNFLGFIIVWSRAW